jgi:hypothetical protein
MKGRKETRIRKRKIN